MSAGGARRLLFVVALALAMLPSAMGHVAATSSQAPVRPLAAPLFASDDVLEMRIEAPLQTLFAHAERDPEYSVRGSVSYSDRSRSQVVTLDGVELSVRGHSSRQDTECTFPKLRLRFKAHEQLDASIFRDTRVVKVGTHCGELADGELTPKLGRWANEKSPYREEFVYRLLRAINVPTLATRAARITYVDTSSRDSARQETGAPLVRNAFLLEDERQAVERLGARGVLEPPDGQQAPEGMGVGRFQDASRQFSALDTARLALAQAMIGNFDWAVKVSANDDYRSNSRHGLWNMMALVRRDGTAFPLMYDFDLAGIVTGGHPWFNNTFSRGFLGNDSPDDIEVFAQVQRTRSLFPRAVLDKARSQFEATRSSAYSTLARAPVDDTGRAIARRYLDAFYRDIEPDAAFYVPVVVRNGVRVFLDEQGSQPACDGNAVPVGTPVRVVENRSGLVEAWLLDVQWRYAESSSTPCDDVRRRPLWIDGGAIGSDYPR